MIQSIIDYLNLEIGVLNKFTALNGLVAQIKKFADKEIVFPAIYKSSGNSEGVNLDFTRATLYHRLTGNVSISEEEDETEGAATMRTEKYPMKIVSFFPKNIYDNDNAYIDLDATKNIANLITTQNISGLAEDFQVFYISVLVTSIETDPYNVWNGEFSNIDYSLPSDHCLTSIDYEIEISGNKDCFLNVECGDNYISVKDLLSTVILNEDGDIVVQVLPGNTYQIESNAVQYIWATLPASGSVIFDKSGNNVGTWTGVDEILITALADLELEQYLVKVDGTNLKWANVDDNINDIDDSLTTGGTIKLFSGRDLFQRGSELLIQI